MNRSIVGLFSAAAVATLLLIPTQAEAQTGQHAFGTGVQFQSYTFDEALGTDVATLTMIPVAYSLPLGDRFSIDMFGAYANGQVEKGGLTYTLQGPVDTRVRANLKLTPWAVFSVMGNIPTGNATHDAEESVVASVLSTDILGFQETNWGTGGAVTTGLATAYQGGGWGIGIGASYRLSDGFEPTEGESVIYEPGDEIRVRVGVDRNVGETGKFTAGFTFQNFSEDLYADKNLFQAGNRFRGDASLTFRKNRSTWALFAVNVWRESGDQFLDLVNAQGSVVGDTTIAVGTQNLLVVGLNGSTPLGSSLRIRPTLDFRYQTREEETGEGWLFGAGLDIPLRMFGSYDLFPRGKFSYGALKSFTGESEALWGLEIGATLRWQR